MASGIHSMHQQRPSVEAKLKTLKNDELKEILKAYGKPVSGIKTALQKRCSEVMDEIISRGDTSAFNDLRHRAHNRGDARPRQSLNLKLPTNSYPMPTGSYQSHQLAGVESTMSQQGRPPLKFKDSPFYEVLQTVLPPHYLQEMPQNRNTCRATICISQEIADKIANEGLLLLLYCGVSGHMHPYNPTGIEVTFPNQLECRVNGDDLKHNFKGLKNKPGTTKPVDITSKVRTRPAGYENQISLTYALTTKRYVYQVSLVRHNSPEKLTQDIISRNVISKQSVLDEISRANADSDIVTTSTRMSLKDPVSATRIVVPIRSTVCSHNQCFDANFFLQMMEQAPQWTCPMCMKTISFQSLCVDKYFEDILRNTPRSVEQVDVEPSGEWRIIREDGDRASGGAGRKPRASYDDDFDDDLIEVPDPSNKLVNGVQQQNHLSVTLTPMTAFNTPPLSSREPSVVQSTTSGHHPPAAGDKRQSGVMIDLTISSSDEDEDPPRPAKRHQPSAPPPQNHDYQKMVPVNTSHALQTPSSPPAYDRLEQVLRAANADRPSHTIALPTDSTQRAAPPLSSQQQQQQQQQQYANNSIPGAYNIPRSPSVSRFTPVPTSTSGNGANPVSPWQQPTQLFPPLTQSRSRPPSQSNPYQPFSIRPPPPSSPSGSVGGGRSLETTSPNARASGELRLPPLPPSPHEPSTFNSMGYDGFSDPNPFPALPPLQLGQDFFTGFNYGNWRSEYAGRDGFSGSPG